MSRMSFRAKALFATLPMLLIATGSFAETIRIGAVIPMTGPVQRTARSCSRAPSSRSTCSMRQAG